MATEKEQLPGVPATWPGGFGAYKYSKQAVKVNLATYVGVGVLSIVLSSLASGLSGNKPNGASGVGSLVGFLISTFLSGCGTFIVLAGVNKQKATLGQAADRIKSVYWELLLVSILTTLAAIASLLLFVIPFFIVMPRLVLATYYVIDKKMGAMDALKASWEQTKGHSAKVWGIFGAALTMALLVLTIIGIPFAVYFLIMYSGAMAVLYSVLQKPQTTSQTAPTPQA